MNTSQLYYCGVQCIVVRDGAILLGRRVRSAGEGHWALPGGHMEFAETPMATAARELREETGLVGMASRVGPSFTTYTTETPYVHVPVLFDEVSGAPRDIPGEGLEALGFFQLDELPSPLFSSSQPIVEWFKNHGSATTAVSAQVAFWKFDFVSIDPDENRNRGYSIMAIEDGGDRLVVRSWGRPG